MNWQAQGFEFLIGGLVILFFAYRRFNTPESSRSSTTAFRYHSAAFTYSVLTFGLWLLLTRISFSAIGLEVEGEGPILSALLITGLLPHTPGLDALDRWLRGKLHNVAAIPTEVRRLASILVDSPLERPDELRRQTRSRMLQLGFSEDEVVFEADGSPESQWTTLTSLIVRLRSWRNHPRHGAFLGGIEEWTGLEQRYDALVPKARSFLRAMRHLAQDPPNEPFDAVGREYRAAFLEQADDLYERACKVVSRAVLGCHATHRSRQQELATFGFRIDYRIPITLDQLVAVFLLVFFLMAPVMALATAMVDPGQVPRTLTIALMVSFIYSAAVVCSVYPRDRWQRWAKRRSSGRPWRFYLVAGLMAAGTAGVLSFVTRWVLEGSLSQALRESVARSPWMLMAFTTAFMLALLSDDEPVESVSPVHWRVLEGACQAGVLMLVGVMVHFLLHVTSVSLNAIPPLHVVLPLSGTIGFFLGAFVPTWYRQPEPQPEPQAAVRPIAAAAA